MAGGSVELRADQLGPHSLGPAAPRDVFCAIRYRDNWYWIDNRDFASKRVFTLLMTFFSPKSGLLDSDADTPKIPYAVAEFVCPSGIRKSPGPQPPDSTTRNDRHGRDPAV